MRNIDIQTTQNVNIQHRTASIGERILAALIDYAILISYYIILIAVMDKIEISNDYVIGFFALFPIFFYHLLSEIFLNGQSLGKKALNIKVIKINGAQPSIGNYFVRWIFRPLDIQLGSGAVAIVTIAINGKGQRLGDIVAKTTVVSTKDKSSLQQTIYTQTSPDYQVKYEEVMFLDDEDVNTVKEVLEHYYRNITVDSAVRMLKQTRDALCKKVNIKTEEPPAQFLKTVLRDYSALHKDTE